MPDGVVENAPSSGAPKIAVAVCSACSGVYALKWALEKEVPANGLVYLMHVQSPIRWIPNAMGGRFPVDKVHPKMVRQFKNECFLETEKMVNQYRKICDRKKVKSDVCYSVSDSVQEELVDQISKLGITKLVLGTSQSALSRALKIESISTYIAKHAPGFCDVLVVNKEKLCYIKKGTQAPTPVCSTPLSASEASISLVRETNMGSDEGILRDRRTWSGITDDAINTNGSLGASLDFSQIYPGQRLEHIISSNEAHHSPQINRMTRNQSTPSASRLSDASSSTPSDRSWDSPGYNIAPLGNRPESEASPVHETPSAIEDGFLDGVGMLHAFTPNHDNYRVMETLERIQYPDIDSLSQIGASSIVETPAMQRPSLPHENGLLSPNMSFVNGSAVVFPEADPLQNQLNEARLFTDRAQKEAEWQTRFLIKAQQVAASAKRMVVEHERHRLEALREAKKAMQQAANDAKRCEEALSALELARKDHDRFRGELAEAAERHQKIQMELETQKRINNSYAMEAALANQKVEAERKRYQETTVKLEDLSRRLEIECHLRKEAEDKASLEAVAKLDALAALRRERRMYAEYSYEELQSATNGFHEENKLGEGGYGPVYKGKLRHTSVAIKVLGRERSRSREEFQREVEVLSRIRHPHMLMLLGACPEKGCIVYEYMANGSLEDRLNCTDGTPPLPWYARFRICFEVATALLFFHSQPEPIVHRDLKPGNILLDHHFVSKIGDVGLARLVPENLTFSITMYRDTVPVGTFAYIDPDYQRTGVVSCESDVYALGIIMLQLLTGKPAVGVAHLVEEAEKEGKLEEVLDKSAGDWALEEARKLACISLKCTEFKRRDRPRLEMDILPILESIQNVAKLAAANMASVRPSSSRTRPIVPSFFFCPILQEIMEVPCMAADGFSYEHHAIKVWLQANNTSPMTNLRLEHKKLTPNYTLRSAIREWYDKGLIQI